MDRTEDVMDAHGGPHPAGAAEQATVETLPERQSPGRMFAEMFETSPEAGEAGVPVKMVESDPPVIVWIRSTSSEKVRAVRNDIVRRNRAKWRVRPGGSFSLTPAEEDAIDIEMCVRGIVAKWENVPDPADLNTTLAYSVENAQRVLSDPRFRAFRNAIMEMAGADETFKAAALKEIRGN